MKYYIKGYESILDLKETELAIKLVKDTFEEKLAKRLDLLRVSAPLFVDGKSGLNDNLTGVEEAVKFVVEETKEELEIVQSLAKWKRHALKKYNIGLHKGLYTDMNAIRRFEELDNMHSLYVDQWDWEKTIENCDRNIEYLKDVVRDIYECIKETEDVVAKAFPKLKKSLVDDIYFITSSELEERYPNNTRKERENLICKEKKSVFLLQIGDDLKDGKPHDGRASDYDDWTLNGDLLLWYEELGIAFELSSMGIRVNRNRLLYQLDKKKENYKLNCKYHQDIINEELPLTIGGGIGQSRMCMYFLKKVHIGEVQASHWSKEDIEEFSKLNINLL